MNEITSSNDNSEKHVFNTSSNGNAEVFVLPPDLLLKLGINLEEGLISQETCTDVTTPKSGFIKNADVRKCDDTILETADLMKKSILLSPTFSSSISNIPGELEMANIFNDCQSINVVSDVAKEVDIINAIHKTDNIEPKVININESFSNCISSETNCDKEIDQQYVHVEITNKEVICVANHINILNQTNSTITTYHINLDNNENPSADCNSSDINISNIKKVLIDNSLTDHDNMKNSATQNLKKYDKKENSVETLHSNMYLENVNDVNINSISEITNSVESYELKRSSDMFHINPDTLKNTVKDREHSENSCSNCTCFKESGYACINKKKIDMKLLSCGNNSSDEKLPNNIIMPCEYKNVDCVSLDNTDKDCTLQPCLNEVVKDVSIINDMKEICYNSLESILHNNLNEKAQKHDSNNSIKCDNAYIDTCDIHKIEQVAHKNTDLGNTYESFEISNSSLHNSEEAQYNQSVHNSITNVNLPCNIPRTYERGGKNLGKLNEECYRFSNDLGLGIHKLIDIENTSKLKDNLYTCNDVLANINFDVIMDDPGTLNSNLHLPGIVVSEDLKSKDFDHSKIKVLKTYERCNKTKKSLRKASVGVECENKIDVPKLIPDDVIETDIANLIQNQKHCVCGDFGKLKFYDNDDPYEHIHFWNQKYCDINLELIYSIYIDETNIIYRDTLVERKNNKDDVGSKTLNNICWNDSELNTYKHITKKDLYTNSNSSRELYCTYDAVESKSAASEITGTIKKFHTLDTTSIDNNKNENNNMEEDNFEKINGYENIESDDLIISHDDKRNAKKGYRRDDASKEFYNKSSSCDMIKPANFITPVNDSQQDEPECVYVEIDLEETISSNIASSGSNNTKIKNMKHTNKKFGHDPLLSPNLKSNENSAILNTNTSKKIVKCGVCQDSIEKLKWLDHIAEKHNYIAWKDSESALDLLNEDKVKEHLNRICKQQKGLICSKCSVVYKYVHFYLKHVKKCGANKANEICKDVLENSTTSQEEESPKNPKQKENKVSEGDILSPESIESSNLTDEEVKCGVCTMRVSSSSWLNHISKEHNYLAWKDGTSPIDLNDEYEVEKHLKLILKQCGELRCKKCDCRRKYIKPYMAHIKTCDYTGEDSNVNEITEQKNITDSNIIKDDHNITCGVCDVEMKYSNWLMHIQQMHNYMAWIKGEKSLDMNDAEAIQNHLMSIAKKIGGLKCAKCGLIRKYVRTFLQHVKTCTQANTSADGYDASLIKTEDGFVQCGVCFESMEHTTWKNHAMTKHYNIAWLVGEIPIDLKNFYAVNRYLDDYKKKYNKLVCKVCRISRVSCYGFYAHILFCGKTEEETEKYKSLCEICNNKYICIYKHQHMAAHREQVYAQERKLKSAEASEKLKEQNKNEMSETPGRRKAAERAKDVLMKYKIDINDDNLICKKCGFEAKNESNMEQHYCSEANDNGSCDSDVSVKLENYSDNDSFDTDVDSNVSDEYMQVDKKRKRYSDHNSTAAKVPRLPYSVKNVSSYIKKSYADFCQEHLTSDILFAHWRGLSHEIIGEEEIAKYKPTVKTSCKVRFNNNDDWVVYKLFQAAAIGNNHIVFVGGIIQCMSWAPCRVDDEEGTGVNYLAVASHSGFKCPDYKYDETSHHSNLIQIWDFGDNVRSMPKFAFGIAHDYGSVWSLDWCPSGARDLPAQKTDNSESDPVRRLGLLAAACSNGSVYIFSVPYPDPTIENEKSYYRLKPVVELRLSMTEDRRTYQATSLSWFAQKGHGIIIVGYSDGLIAFYDLYSDSPLLTKEENGVTIIHPYHDERSHSTCIIGVGSYAGGSSSEVDLEPARAWSTASNSGARACAGLPGRSASLHTQLASTAATFTPHWPSVQLTGDSNNGKLSQTVNELEFLGGGRRVGGTRIWCACARCGMSAAVAPPVIRVLHAHPAYLEIKKTIIGILDVAPIGTKRKHNNDELSIKLEPFDYEKAVKKYGLVYNIISAKNKLAQQKAAAIPGTVYPELYPLADITCMAFCPSAACHDKLAMATQAGIILYINV